MEEKKSLQAIHWIKSNYPEYIKSSKIKHQKPNYPINKWANKLNR
jgi:hypothetical protein